LPYFAAALDLRVLCADSRGGFVAATVNKTETEKATIRVRLMTIRRMKALGVVELKMRGILPRNIQRCIHVAAILNAR
ncbi:MAG: hypothetical protein WA020_14915, partial [Candidatus Acidiferrales bacterium]